MADTVKTIVNSSGNGIKKLVYAIMTDEVLETYSSVKDAPPLISIKTSPKNDTGSLRADNRVVETATVFSEASIDVETQDMPLEIQAEWLGHTLDPLTGIMKYNANDIAPYIALGYERTKTNGKSRFVWFYKCKFEDIEEDAKTQEEKISFQTPKIKGIAISNKDGDWKSIADENTKGTPITDFLTVVGGKVTV